MENVQGVEYHVNWKDPQDPHFQKAKGIQDIYHDVILKTRSTRISF
jgi:hypothetical protein